MEISSYTMQPDFRKTVRLFEGSQKLSVSPSNTRNLYMEMSVEQWWNDTDGKTEVLGEKYYTVWVVNGWMSMEQWWNDTDRGKLKYWEKNIIKCGW